MEIPGISIAVRPAGAMHAHVGVSKVRAPFLGVPTIRIIVCWGLDGGPPDP